MSKRTFFILLATILATAARAQLTLQQCLDWAHDNYPAVKRYGLIEQSRDYTVANAAKGWLPQVSISANAGVFTDILDMPTMLTQTVGDISNNLYGANITVSQTLYDGGEIAARKRTDRTQAEVERGRLDASIYDVDSRIYEMFFAILTINEQLEQNRLLQDDLRLSLQTVVGMIGGGIANESDADAVRVEQARARQQQASLETSRDAYTKMLSSFTGHAISASTEIEKPTANATFDHNIGAINRPEMHFYAANRSLLDEQRRALDTRLMPRVKLFGMGAYHNRVLGAMKNNLFAAGITLSWNVGALYTRKNDILNLQTKQADIEAQSETFLFNTRLQEQRGQGNIENLRKQMEIDDEIVRLRENIRSTTEKKVKGGTETVNELMRNINAVSEARQTKALHEIQLLREIYLLRHTLNQ